MSTKNRTFALTLFWEHMAESLLKYEDEKTIHMDNDVGVRKDWKAGDCRTLPNGDFDLFPAQHYIMPCVDFDSKAKIRPVGFWKWSNGVPKVNQAYLEIWTQWKVRSVSNDSFIPEDKKELFIDKLGCIVSDIDLGDLANPEAFIAKQKDMFKDRFNA